MTVKGVSIESIPKELLGGVDPKDVKVGYLDTEGNLKRSNRIQPQASLLPGKKRIPFALS